MPEPEGGGEAGDEKQRAAGIADAERAVGKISKGGACCGGGDDGGPIEGRVKPVGADLGDDKGNEKRGEDGRADEIAKVHGHGDSVAAGLAERGGGDLDDPENERDFRHLAHDFVGRAVHFKF